MKMRKTEKERNARLLQRLSDQAPKARAPGRTLQAPTLVAHKSFAGIDHILTQYGLCHFGLPPSGLANKLPCAR